jgi:catechol 2,3-dioxygenase-like lactoylglutathione lyase family enzyme
MKRLHVHVAVDDLAVATAFYADLFGAAPSVTKPDYAKWMLDDPRVNFAISARGTQAGLDHLGIQVDDAGELDMLAARLENAGHTTYDKGAATCCYAESDKAWTVDPAGIKWEAFHTHGESTTYGAPREIVKAASACCGPSAKKAEAQTAKACC